MMHSRVLLIVVISLLTICNEALDCPSVCEIKCEFGNELDDDGCPTCACNDPCKNCTEDQICMKSIVQCIAAPCQPLGECVDNICEVGTPKADSCMHREDCEEYYECRTDPHDRYALCCPPDNDGVGHSDSNPNKTLRPPVAVSSHRDDGASTTPALKVHPGTCPEPIGMGTCVEACSSDTACDLDSKCCSNGCGHGCFKAVSNHVLVANACFLNINKHLCENGGTCLARQASAICVCASGYSGVHCGISGAWSKSGNVIAVALGIFGAILHVGFLV